MKRTVASQILRRIRAKGRAWVFTPKDLVDIGTREAVDQALHRLSEQGIIQRLDRGIYYFATEAERDAPLRVDALARALAAQTGGRAMLTGEEAAQRLGLTEITPKPDGEHVYCTTGRARRREVAGIAIRFRKSFYTPPAQASDATVTVMQALLYLGREHMTPEVIATCARALQASEREQLRRLASRAPAWLIPVLHTISGWQEPGRASPDKAEEKPREKKEELT